LLVEIKTASADLIDEQKPGLGRYLYSSSAITAPNFRPFLVDSYKSQTIAGMKSPDEVGIFTQYFYI
jgi:hypothetical protein